tara:strand:- start:2605 stop:3255 length:651 start_codon:yes stop_codon:yes gene_type:complete
MRIGIIGGNFNPIHIGHISMIEEVQKSFNLDKILLIPNSNPHYKETKNIRFESAVEMIKLGINEQFDYEISDLESNPNDKHYALNTLHTISKTYSNNKLLYIIGSDQFLKFESWYKPDEIKKLINIVVPIRTPYFIDVQNWIDKNEIYSNSRNYGRKTLLKSKEQKMMIFYDLVNKIDISSYEVKKMLIEKNFDAARNFLPDKVFEYILDNKIYDL